jgi:hypothetical protein
MRTAPLRWHGIGEQTAAQSAMETGNTAITR